MFSVFEVGNMYDETVCEGKIIARGGLDGKTVSRLAGSPGQ
jgi:hypothetical protein